MRLVVKHLPYRYRDFSFLAAEASLAARDQGKFREMHTLLHERSPALSRERLIAYAKELGLDTKRFAADLDSLRHKGEIDRDLRLAETLDLYNTPTFFINGIKVVGNRPYEYLKEILDRELSNPPAKAGGRR